MVLGCVSNLSHRCRNSACCTVLSRSQSLARCRGSGAPSVYFPQRLLRISLRKAVDRASSGISQEALPGPVASKRGGSSASSLCRRRCLQLLRSESPSRLLTQRLAKCNPTLAPWS